MRLKELMDDPIRRKDCYKIAAEEFDTSVDAMKKTALRAGLTSSAHSLHYILSAKNEEGLLALCVKYARHGEPLSIPDLVDLVSKFKGCSKDECVSRHFVSDFVERHKEVLCSKQGKPTSPKRSSKVMDKETEHFIKKFSKHYMTNRVNEQNLFVCDETIIGDPVVKDLRVGERRKSGGGNTNMFQNRGKALGCFLPITKCDGTTPFRVFVSKEKKSKRTAVSEAPTDFDIKVKGGPELQRLYTSNESGYITIPLFKCILDHFSKWWKQQNPGLFCYLVCDRLPVHVNDDVKKFAKARGIIIMAIMPGSSHWFQVHDQQPFGTLKKKKWEFKKVGFRGFPPLHLRSVNPS